MRSFVAFVVLASLVQSVLSPESVLTLGSQFNRPPTPSPHPVIFTLLNHITGRAAREISREMVGARSRKVSTWLVFSRALYAGSTSTENHNTHTTNKTRHSVACIEPFLPMCALQLFLESKILLTKVLFVHTAHHPCQYVACISCIFVPRVCAGHSRSTPGSTGRTGSWTCAFGRRSSKRISWC